MTVKLGIDQPGKVYLRELEGAPVEVHVSSCTFWCENSGPAPVRVETVRFSSLSGVADAPTEGKIQPPLEVPETVCGKQITCRGALVISRVNWPGLQAVLDRAEKQGQAKEDAVFKALKDAALELEAIDQPKGGRAVGSWGY